MPRLNRQHRSGPSTEPRRRSESEPELRYGWLSAHVGTNLGFVTPVTPMFSVTVSFAFFWRTLPWRKVGLDIALSHIHSLRA